ncbi:hypothetical protein BDZ97DRAFT_1051430 [Flammula alnicola]|nr:hypothetical protein BDZ97DRAFT_1051430 [Flammula alnicola]
MLGGPMDSQDRVVWGEVRPEYKKRIDDLCMWGRQYNIDGFLSMKLELTRACFIPQPRPNHKRSTTSQAARRHPNSFSLFRVILAGSWHNHYPGDTHTQSDYSRSHSDQEKSVGA